MSGAFTVAGTLVGLVMMGGTVAAAMVMLSVAEPAPMAFLTSNTTNVAPGARGVPVIAPVVVFRMRPSGRLLAA